MRETIVVVTGGGRGIGRSICRRFAAGGAQVIAASRSVNEINETKSLIENAGGRCHVAPTDLSKPLEIQALMDGVVDRYGCVDVLVNCAGVGLLRKIEELDPKSFEAILSVNVIAVYYTCRAVWPIMKAGNGGVIVNISSVASVDPFPGFAAYGASKAWVNTWTKALADEGKEVGIRVYAVAPGAVETQMLRSAFPDYPADETLPPERIAEIVCTMAQPDCEYGNGETVFVKT